MKVILAALFLFIAMFLGADFIFDFGNEDIERSIIRKIFNYIAYAVYMAVIFSLSMILFNKNGWRNFKGQTTKDYVKELETKEKLIKEPYNHKRSLSFEELRTSCLVYFIEVNNSDVLCLYGQYLYEYSEITDDEEVNQERQFPTDNFTLLKNEDNGELIDIDLHGKVTDCLMLQEPDFDLLNNLLSVNLFKYDGKIIPNITFDQLLSIWN